MQGVCRVPRGCLARAEPDAPGRSDTGASVRLYPVLRKSLRAFCLLLLSALLSGAAAESVDEAAARLAAAKTSSLSADTPVPRRFVAEGTSIIDLARHRKVFFKGIGYSPFLQGETPLQGAAPADDGRYAEHLALLRRLGVNYLHVFTGHLPAGFFAALDKTPIVYGQEIPIFVRARDFLDPAYQVETLAHIKDVIDHAYRVGRPDRLVLFSIGDELQPQSITRTDALHPGVQAFHGKHVRVSHRTPSEIAVARLIDAAMDYELRTYGQRHLYCHTSFTHVGPIANRYDLEVPFLSALTPDIGDLICLNVYTYARGVVTSPPGSVTGTPYQGYLEALTAQARKPIFITQVGLSTSPTEPKPWVPGFGGHKVSDVPDVFRSVWRDIRTAKGHEKICGMSFFELQDEWWKNGQQPTDFDRHDAGDPEEWFGIYELGPDRRLVPKAGIPAAVREIFTSTDAGQDARDVAAGAPGAADQSPIRPWM